MEVFVEPQKVIAVLKIGNQTISYTRTTKTKTVGHLSIITVR